MHEEASSVWNRYARYWEKDRVGKPAGRRPLSGLEEKDLKMRKKFFVKFAVSLRYFVISNSE